MNRDLLNWDMLRQSTGAWIGLIVAILALAVVIARVRALYREDDDPAGGLQQLLNDAEEMHRRGELSPAEYRSIQSRLSRRIVGHAEKGVPGARQETSIRTEERAT